MQVYHIPREKWDDFGRFLLERHRGKQVALEVYDGSYMPTGSERRKLAHAEIALHDIVFDSDANRFIVVEQGARGEKIQHVLIAPTIMRLEQPDTERGGALHIDSEECSQSLFIRFNDPVIPGVLNGYA